MRGMAILVAALLILTGCGEKIEAQEKATAPPFAREEGEAAPDTGKTQEPDNIEMQDPVAFD